MQTKHPQASGLNRRDLFRYGLAAATALGLSSVGRAQEQDSPAEEASLLGAGFYRHKLGDFELGLIADGDFTAPAMTFAANQSEDVVAAEAIKRFTNPQEMRCHVNAMVVKQGDRVTLIDAGCGGNFGATLGNLKGHLGRFGVRPEQVNTVVFTHLHVDHCGGIVGGQNADLFPNAEFVVTQTEHDFWMGENPDLSQTGVPAENRAFFVEVAQKAVGFMGDRLRLIQAGDEIVPGLTSVDLPGHTPGHIGVMIDSRGETLFYVTDAIHNAKIQMANPTWHVAFDTDPVQAAKMRQRALDRAAVERLMIAGAHLPFPALGHVRPMGGGYEWEPVMWAWS